jgi:hypothetical protein
VDDPLYFVDTIGRLPVQDTVIADTHPPPWACTDERFDIEVWKISAKLG